MSIPLTQLGGKAFSHSVGNDSEAEYDRLRDLARAEASKRNSCFDRAHQAYERGDGAAAKELSNEGKRHAAKMDEYNKQASEYIFRENNAAGRVDADTVDLHGQFVEEAEDILEARIRDARARRQTHLHVIVGKGNHSADHVQRLKPRVEQVCRELGLRYETEENAGRIYVDLTDGRGAGEDAHEGGAPGAGKHKKPRREHGGQGGQQHGGGAGRPHHQRPPQQQEPDEPETIVGRVVRKLADCCVIM
ncbi:Smr domain protein [Biscogniauxia marginata]|nr:Smr domain protein [Biscogniauxia marginata]